MLRKIVRQVMPASSLPTLKNVHRAGEYFATRFKMLAGKRYLAIRLDTTNRCNLKCKYCYTLDGPVEKPLVMGLELFNKLADELFYKASMVALSCASEPTMNKNFSKYIDISAKYHVPNLFYVTNGQLLNEEIMLSSINAPVHEVSISMDASEKDLYERIRVNASFEKLIENLTRFSDLKKKHHSKFPALSISYTIFRENADQAPKFIEKFGKYIDIFNINPLLLRDRNKSVEFSRLSQEEISAVYAKCREAAQSQHVIVNSFYGSVLKKPVFCPTALRYALIRPDGNVFLCNKQCIGNLTHHAFSEIVKANRDLLKNMIRGNTEFCQKHCGT